MRTVEENIKMLSRSILTEAQTEADKILEEAKVKAESVKRHAEEQAKTEREQILEEARRESERLRGQVVATTQLKARTQILENREKVLNDVFKAAHEQLSTIQQWSEYKEIAQGLLPWLVMSCVLANAPCSAKPGEPPGTNDAAWS